MSTGKVQLRTTTQGDLPAGPRLRATAPADVSKICILWLMFCVSASACEHGKTQSVSSPNGVVQALIHASNDGQVRYSVNHHGVQVVLDSKLGIKMENTSFGEGPELKSATNPRLILDHYSMMTVKRKHIT